MNPPEPSYVVHRWLERRLDRPQPLGRGLVALAATGLGYAFAILLLAAGGDRPGPEPWLAIPRETYFWWEAAFIAPVIVAGGVLGAASLHLLALAAGGRGRFEDTMALTGWSVAASTLCTLVPDVAIGVLLCTGLLAPETFLDGVSHPSAILAGVWAYLLLYVAAFLVTFATTARVAHGLGWSRAAPVGVAAFAVYQLFLYVFVR